MTRFPSSARLFAAVVVLPAAACESPVAPPDSAFAQLTNLGGEEPVWSPDGTRIAFTSHRHYHSSIYVMDADGSDVERLTNFGRGSAASPAWSPDGTRIAFASNSHDGNAKVHVMDADGSGVEQVTNHSGNDQHPAWSPDGTRIAFDSNGDRPLQHREIYVIRIK